MIDASMDDNNKTSLSVKETENRVMRIQRWKRNEEKKYKLCLSIWIKTTKKKKKTSTSIHTLALYYIFSSSPVLRTLKIVRDKVERIVSIIKPSRQKTRKKKRKKKFLTKN